MFSAFPSELRSRVWRAARWALVPLILAASPLLSLAAEAPAGTPASPAPGTGTGGTTPTGPISPVPGTGATTPTAPATPAAPTTNGAAPAPAGTAIVPPARVLSLEDTVSLALENNRSVQGAAERLRQAEARVGEATAPSRLQARAAATLTRMDQKTTVNFGGGQGGGTPQSVTIGELYTRTATLAVTYPIDISHALRTSRNIAELGVVNAQLDVERTREQTVLDTENSYLAVLRAQAALGVAQANAASLDEHLRQVQAFYRQDVAAKFDVLRAEAQAANARQLVISARNAVDLAKASLNNVVGIDVTTPVELTPVNLTGVEHPDFAQSVQLAYERRPEAKQARVGVELAQRNVELQRTGNRPTLGLGFNVNATPDVSVFSPRAVQWNATATVSVPILEGGLTRARVQEAQAGVGAAEVNEEQVKQGLALDVQQALLSMNDAAERLRAAQSNLTQATEAVRLSKLRFQEGVATALEVTDAQAVLTQAESNEVNARYDYLLARARYERAIGPGGAPEAATQPAAAGTAATPATGAAPAAGAGTTPATGAGTAPAPGTGTAPAPGTGTAPGARPTPGK